MQIIVSLKYCFVYGFYFLDGEQCVSKVATESTVTPVDGNKKATVTLVQHLLN